MEHLIIPEGYEPALNLHDTQIAINRGWFALESGRFNPEKTITKSEIENMVSDAKTVQQSTQIDENYKNNYEFTSNVI